MPNHNVEVTLNWDFIKKVTVHFEVDDATSVADVILASGYTLNQVTSTLEGYTFT